MSVRNERLAEIQRALGRRRVSWFGIRGIDAIPYAQAGLLTVAASQIAPLQGLAGEEIVEDCLETRLRRRVEHNRYDIDRDQLREARSLRESLLARRPGETGSDQWALVAYRPAAFLSAIGFTRSEVLPCFMFNGAQGMFEHKPWVEREFESLGLRSLGWQYIRDSEEHLLRHALDTLGRIVVRSSYTSGGVGVQLISSLPELRNNIPVHDDGFIGYSPYLDRALPLNLNACVYRDGQVRTFHVSVQLIGIDGCSRLRFGFCGNDLAAAASLDPAILVKAELIAERVGRWAADHGYVGQFGLDFLLHDNELMITEMNPRFQASTILSEEAARAQEATGPYLEHLAAFLGLPAPSMAQMPDVVTQTQGCAKLVGECSLSQIICYNDRETEIRLVGTDMEVLPSDVQLVGVAEDSIIVDRDAMLGKLLAKDRVTNDGYTLLESFSRVRNVFRTSQVL